MTSTKWFLLAWLLSCLVGTVAADAPDAAPAKEEAPDDVEEEEEETTTGQPPPPQQEWIRGVNLGGWLLMERYITPYQFAVTSCHLQGDFCWYPEQINAPPNAPLCDLYRCHAHLSTNVLGQPNDFPMDEYTLWQAFGNNTAAAEDWLNYHLEYFITEDDIAAIAASGATHIRVPMAHWILQDQADLVAADEVWIVGKRWHAFQRVVQWARQYQLQVWPDIHTAPGSQNGFDNSGRQYAAITCQRWMDHPDHVFMSLQVIRQVTQQIANEGMHDVVTGFGLVNEPFQDCNMTLYKDFVEEGLRIVRDALGEATYVYVSDLFQSESFNDGHWWLDAAVHHDTFLDSHYYHVFAETTRAISPRQHIALTCQNEYHVTRNPKKTQGGVAACCWQDGPHNNTVPSATGVKHMVGEWSAAVDTLPMDMLYAVMTSIAVNGTALHLQRELSPARQDFLRNFVQAQMVIYEMADHPGLGGAWFFWTAKMEGGAFAEWDYLRGIREGWIPKLPASNATSSQSLYGSCYEIMARTSDNASLVHEFPAPQDDSDNWQGMALDDDVVLTHGDSILHPELYPPRDDNYNNIDDDAAIVERQQPYYWYLPSAREVWATALVAAFLVGLLCLWRRTRGRKSDYTSIPQTSMPA